jgi:hypothetical protein
MHPHGPIGRPGAVWVDTTIPGRGNVHRPGPDHRRQRDLTARAADAVPTILPALPLAVHGCSLRTSAQCRAPSSWDWSLAGAPCAAVWARSLFHARAEEARILADVSDHTRFKALASSAPVGRWRSSVPAPALSTVNPLRRFARSRQRHQRRVCVEAASRTRKPHQGRWTDSCRRRTQPLASTRADMLPQGRSRTGRRNVAQELSEAVRLRRQSAGPSVCRTGGFVL